MRTRSKLMGFTAGVGLALVIAPLALSPRNASAARSRGGFKVVSISVADAGDVALNQPIEIRFSARVAGSSLKDGSISVVPLDVETDTVGDARPGQLTRRGNVVTFTPTLPTHVVEPIDPDAGFLPPGPQPDAFEHGSLRPGSAYRVIVNGRSDAPAVRSTERARLRSTTTADFLTAPESGSAPLFLAEETFDVAPPRVHFANPLDRVATASRGYTRTTGTPAVPTAADVTLFCNAIPLDPGSLTAPGAVELLKVAPLAPEEAPVSVAGNVLVEQDRRRTSLVFRPAARLDEQATYALRIAATVTDLTGDFAVQNEPERQRLQDTYDYLSAVRRIDIGIPPEHYPDPPADLVYDWPLDMVERGELKVRLLDIGDTQPWAIDPRVFAVFTTRREVPVNTQEGGSPAAARRTSSALAKVTRQVTPLGVQGVSGGDANGHVVLPFTLVDRRSRKGTVELEFGTDLNADGLIADDEYRPLTVDRVDPRNTGFHSRPGGKRGWPFVTAPDSGRSNAIVWRSQADVDRGVFRTFDVIYTPQGREIDDPNNPGTPLFAPEGTGVIVRMRSARGRRKSSDWTYTKSFELSNGTEPSLTIDAVSSGAHTLLDWSAIDDDSEDFNGNRVLDPLLGEDRNGNGVLDEAFIAVAFDFAVLADGEDVDALTQDELAALDWVPCTRDAAAGDPDVDRQSSPTGIAHTFAWDHDADGVEGGSRVILRGRTFDETRLRGAWIYRTEPTTIGE